ncbi:hypothetical protein ASF55_15090 [Methylobacterium sp. Leaf119]|nr:hypothetical protein ASF55_15090 [Methylobacterium sp. Leaf119]
MTVAADATITAAIAGHAPAIATSPTAESARPATVKAATMDTATPEASASAATESARIRRDASQDQGRESRRRNQESFHNVVSSQEDNMEVRRISPRRRDRTRDLLGSQTLVDRFVLPTLQRCLIPEDSR